jgi:hypothetical protein
MNVTATDRTIDRVTVAVVVAAGDRIDGRPDAAIHHVECAGM